MELLHFEYLSIEAGRAIECKRGVSLIGGLLEMCSCAIGLAGAQEMVRHQFEVFAAFGFDGSR
jgi:hypothetical protein